MLRLARRAAQRFDASAGQRDDYAQQRGLFMLMILHHHVAPASAGISSSPRQPFTSLDFTRSCRRFSWTCFYTRSFCRPWLPHLPAAPVAGSRFLRVIRAQIAIHTYAMPRSLAWKHCRAKLTFSTTTNISFVRHTEPRAKPSHMKSAHGTGRALSLHRPISSPARRHHVTGR